MTSDNDENPGDDMLESLNGIMTILLIMQSSSYTCPIIEFSGNSVSASRP